MERITKDLVLSMKASIPPHKRCFSEVSGFQESRQDGKSAFVVRFTETIGPLLTAATGIKLRYGAKHNNYFCIFSDTEQLQRVKDWEREQGDRVFLKDCLSLSLALGMNMEAKKEAHTELGRLEYMAKEHRDSSAITTLAERSYLAITSLPFYKDADFLCSVPSSKEFNLPGRIVSLLSKKLSLPDVTSGFSFPSGKFDSIKSATFKEKWDIWENSNVTFHNPDNTDITGKSIILLDDKYQSGITLQYIAMKLQEAGAKEVYGLCMVKTLRDTDNVH